MPDLRIADDLRVVLHRRMPDLARLHEAHPFRGRPGREAMGDELPDLVLLAPGVLVAKVGEPRLADRLGYGRQGGEGQREVTVAGPVDPVGCRVIPAADVAEGTDRFRLLGRIEPGDERLRL